MAGCDVQLDDVWMSKRAHVVDFAEHSRLDILLSNQFLGDIFHCYGVSGHNVSSHCVVERGQQSPCETWPIARTLDFAECAFGYISDDMILA